MNENDEQRGTVDDVSNSGKTSAETISDIGQKGRTFHSWWQKIKEIKALAPLVEVIGTIAVVIGIIFLAIGFVTFFVTMPGIFVAQFLEACKNFWSNIVIDDEKIEINHENYLNLANYIESLGYNVVGFGFATQNSVTREDDMDPDSKITDINLTPTDENSDIWYRDAINTITIMTSTNVKLQRLNQNEEIIYPASVLNDANIIMCNNELYRAVDKDGNNISFFDERGNEIKYRVEINDKGEPVFTKFDSGLITFSQLNKKITINENEYGIDGVSFNDLKKMIVKNNSNNNMINSDLLKPINTFVDYYYSCLLEYDDYIFDENSVTRAALPLLRNIFDVDLGTDKNLIEICMSVKNGFTIRRIYYMVYAIQSRKKHIYKRFISTFNRVM